MSKTLTRRRAISPLILKCRVLSLHPQELSIRREVQSQMS